MLTALASIIGAILYRLRGGWLKTLTGTHSTQLSRTLWAVPTGLLIWWLSSTPGWVGAALVLSVALSMALIGHGAHMVMGAQMMATGKFTKTELLTEFWIPDVFGGIPDPTWLETRPQDIVLYNIVGMSFIGLIRNSLAIFPLFWFAPISATVYAISGLSHGPLYWLGWQVSEDVTAPELLVGAVTWATILLLLG